MPQATQETPTPTVIPSVLLALRRMRPSSPWHILPHLKGPKSPPQYNFLDAFATLCSFVPQCNFASAAIQQGPQSNRLYIATSPSASPTLRKLISALISALPAADLSPCSTNQLDGIDRFVVEAYRSCHGKLLDAIRRDNCEWLLEDLSDMSLEERHSRNISEEGYTSLVDAINSLMASKEKDASTFLETDFVDLHHVAQNIGEFKDEFSVYPCESTPIRRDANVPLLTWREPIPVILGVGNISRAVDTIVAWATVTSPDSKKQSINLPLEVVFVDLPSAPDFLATTNTDEMSTVTGVDKNLYNSTSRAWGHFEPSEGVSEVEGSPGHFTGHGAVHCESALLHQILDKRIPVHPYIGCSHPTCYACFMLVTACGWATGQPFSVGCPSADLEQLDVAWSYPPGMGTSIYKKLERDILADFRKLCVYADGNDRRHPVSIGEYGRPDDDADRHC